MWELVLYMGISWAGIGQASVNTMPDKETCFQSLETMKINNGVVGQQSSGEAGKSIVAFCRYNENLKGK